MLRYGGCHCHFYPLKQSVKESVGEDRPTLRTHGQPGNTLKATRWIEDKFGREKDPPRGRPVATHSRGVGRDFFFEEKDRSEEERRGETRGGPEQRKGEKGIFFLPLQLGSFSISVSPALCLWSGLNVQPHGCC